LAFDVLGGEFTMDGAVVAKIRRRHFTLPFKRTIQRAIRNSLAISPAAVAVVENEEDAQSEHQQLQQQQIETISVKNDEDKENKSTPSSNL
jgi:hypothetical protein